MGATHMFALVRTEPDAPKHDGITYLLIDLDQPVTKLQGRGGDGIEVVVNGESSEWTVTYVE